MHLEMDGRGIFQLIVYGLNNFKNEFLKAYRSLLAKCFTVFSDLEPMAFSRISRCD